MKQKIGIIGLGYVGLPLLLEFGKKFKSIGFDISRERVEELKKGYDRTREVTQEEFEQAVHVSFTDSIKDLEDCNFYIITVPTPIDQFKIPDLNPLIKASEIVSSLLSEGDIVVYESTVFPGCTEEICVPILENGSGLKHNINFFTGYSPERINPGDKEHRLKDIRKITSGSLPEIAIKVNELYQQIIIAGTYLAPSIKVAEAAKVIENTQRDINIALINELAILFNKLSIDTSEVLEAAATKWNFLPFKPGLVGGHCIGVDPYYLTYKAISIGYNPELILAGRRLNDNMADYVSGQFIKAMSKKKINIFNSNILILGFTFKEDCPDIRNTKIIDIVLELKEYGVNVDVYDPWVDSILSEREYGIKMIKTIKENYYEGVIIAVKHREFSKMGIDNLKKFLKENSVIYDLKNMLNIHESDLRL